MDASDIIYLVLAILAALASAFSGKKKKNQEVFKKENRMPGKDPFFPDWEEEEPNSYQKEQGNQIPYPTQRDMEEEWEDGFFPPSPTTATIPPISPSPDMKSEIGEVEKETHLTKTEITNGIFSHPKEMDMKILKKKEPVKVHPIIREIRKPDTLRKAVIFSEVLKPKGF